MRVAGGWKDYELLDASSGERLERWGNYVLVRPDPQVIWNTPKTDPRWRSADAIAKAALEDPCCKTNPMPVEDFLVRRILEEVTGRV